MFFSKVFDEVKKTKTVSHLVMSVDEYQHTPGKGVFKVEVSKDNNLVEIATCPYEFSSKDEKAEEYRFDMFCFSVLLDMKINPI